jgi:hypothetical protein
MRSTRALEAQPESPQLPDWSLSKMTPEKFSGISVILASHRTDSINSLIDSLNSIWRGGLTPLLEQFVSQDVLGIDPELVRAPFRDGETESDTPVIPAVEKIYKILRYYGYLFDPQGSPDQDEKDAALAETNSLLDYVLEHPGEMGLENLKDIKRLIAPFVIRSLVKEKIILSSDVLFSLDGEVVHRQIRNPEEVQKMSPQKLATHLRRLTKKIIEMYNRPHVARWTVSYAGYKKHSIRYSKPMVIEAQVPTLKALLQEHQEEYLALNSSPGIKLIEILGELGVPFTIRNIDQSETEAIAISGAVAKQLVVDKVPLPGMITQLLNERDIGKSIPEVPDRLVKEISLTLPWILARNPKIRPYSRKKSKSA